MSHFKFYSAHLPIIFSNVSDCVSYIGAFFIVKVKELNIKDDMDKGPPLYEVPDTKTINNLESFKTCTNAAMFLLDKVGIKHKDHRNLYYKYKYLVEFYLEMDTLVDSICNNIFNGHIYFENLTTILHYSPSTESSLQIKLHEFKEAARLKKMAPKSN